jgi:hypothetical protein
MSKGKQTVDLEFLNGPEVIDWMTLMAERCLDVGPALHPILTALEKAEENLFASLNGEYVLTGATQASLVGTTSDSIRRVEPDFLEFGTSIWYAIFQGTEPSPKGGFHRGPSAIFPDDATIQDTAADAVMEWIGTSL